MKGFAGNMDGFRPMKTVYSYLPPKVRAIIERASTPYPTDVLMQSLTPPGLDFFHQPVMDRLVERYASAIPALGRFESRYPTSGSEEGIREYMSRIATGAARSFASNTPYVYMLKGDYEGYREVALTRGLVIEEVKEDADFGRLKRGTWFLSNPSARDGNIVAPETIDRILAAGHKLFYDVSYVRSTGPAVYDVSHPNVDAVAVSFSKPFGLFYLRIGFLFSAKPVPGLSGNIWFKNIPSLIAADAVVRELDIDAYAAELKGVQAKLVADLNAKYGLGLRASDAFLLAHLPVADAEQLDEEQRASIEVFRRATDFRFCLSPYLLERFG